MNKCLWGAFGAFFIFFAIGDNAMAHGIPEADRQAMLNGSYAQYVWLGAKHMITGYDHLLFLFGVVFFLTKFIDIVKFVTAFTIGHSLTLIFATFAGITANFWLIDSVIALTVIYKGFDNIDGFRKYIGVNAPSILTLVFAFGLIHGFGLSTRLQQLPLGEFGAWDLLARIVSFNIGVELGQIAALALMLPVLALWRKSGTFARFSFASNAALMILGAFLFMHQMHGYSHDLMVDELAFSADSHAHAHEHMNGHSNKGEWYRDGNVWRQR